VAEVLEKEKQNVIFITTRFDVARKAGNILQLPKFNPKNKILHKLATVFARITGLFYLIYFLKKEKPDVVHLFHSNYLFIPVMIVARILRIPVVFTVLDYYIICAKFGSCYYS